MFNETDYGGNKTEYRTLTAMANPEACCTACTADSTQCRYWVYHRVRNECYLKRDEGSSPGFVRKANLTSGRVMPATGTFGYQWRLSGFLGGSEGAAGAKVQRNVGKRGRGGGGQGGEGCSSRQQFPRQRMWKPCGITCAYVAKLTSGRVMHAFDCAQEKRLSVRRGIIRQQWAAVS